ncbi:vacuole effluxer Atg22 like-domain-containing protein [Tirmania nivea]|nr:vacuole effluxer Atg22 like-domain-containing protein [Tirmania nivea]
MGTHAPAPHHNNSIYEQLFSHSPTRDPYYQHESDPEDADDERSFSEIDEDDPIYRRRHRFHPNNFGFRRNSNCTPQFPAQDVRPTSVKELAGWYSYAWAAEVFVVCGVGSFVPVTLEQLARENGVVLGKNGVTGERCGASERGGVGGAGDAQCVVNILGWWINTASFAMYTFSISVLIQSLVIISMSGAADHGSYRKKLLLVFALMGSISTMLFITVTPRFFLFGAVWAILGNIGFGASFVLLNAFLPVLVRHHPSLLFKSPPPTPLNEGNALLPSTAVLTTYSTENSPVNGSLNGTTDNKPKNPALTLSSQISSYGIAIGYCGAVLMQTFGILLVVSTGSTTWSLQLVLFFVGLWWFVFSIPAAMWLRPRPGPPLPRLNKDGSVWTAHGNGNGNGVNGGVVGGRGESDGGNWRYIAYAWKSLWKTIRRARRLKDVVLFLMAWFMISDGIATVSGTAILFAKMNLHMKPAAVALISVISTLFGVLGAFAWSRFSPYFGVSPSRTILILITIFELIPLYGLLGFIPAVQRWGVIGLTQPYEMYMLGAVYGFVLGGISGYCRSVFGELIPSGSEAAFYALYAITDKGSSIFGPTVVGYMTDKFGNIRSAFWFLAVLLAVPLPLLAMVDVDRGKKEGRQLAEEELRGLGLRDEELRYGYGYGADGVTEEEEEQDLEDGHGRGRDGYQGVSEWVLSEPSGVSGGSGGSAGEGDERRGRGSPRGSSRGYR